jgi:Ca2+-binding EF-hand superfamily protein
MFDTDGNGYIEKDEIKELMGNLDMEVDDWLLLIQEYDTDGDGKVCILTKILISI